MFVVGANVSAKAGFIGHGATTLTSRTIMLDELQRLLEQVPPHAQHDEYRRAVIDENVLSKPTLATRKATFFRMRQIYSLDTQFTIFRVLRLLWGEKDAQPLLAGLCAMARERLFRTTASVLIESAPGEIISSFMFAQAIERTYPSHYNTTTSETIGRNAFSSWQQTGHISNAKEKRRTRVECTPTILAYALLLGYLGGMKGESLFATPWVQILDTTTALLYEQAEAASRRGLLTFRHVGGIIDVNFRQLLTIDEREGV